MSWFEELFINEAKPALNRHSGSGGGDTSVEDGLVMNTLSGTYTNNRITSIGDGGLSGKNITSLVAKNVQEIGRNGVNGCKKLVSVDFGDALKIARDYALAYTGLTAFEGISLYSLGAKVFEGCSSLVSVSLPNITNLGANTFQDCTSLKNVYAPKATSGSATFNRCPGLEYIDLPSLASIGKSFLGSCTSLNTIVLRNNTLCELTNVNGLGGTPFASGGTGGTVYVPSALIESYQTATNWSTLYAAGTCNFVAIEGSEYE